MSNENSNKYQVPILISTGEILQYLSRGKTSNSTLSEISTSLDINKTSCFRILRTLLEMNYVTYNESSKKYSLGPYLVLLGSRALDKIDYLSKAKKYLKNIAKETGFNSAIVQKVSDERLGFMAKEEVENTPQVSISVGRQFPLTYTSFGKCYLAYNKEEERRFLFTSGLEQRTKNTITDIDEYLKELDEVKKKGFALSYEEYLEGISVASAPVFDANGEVLLVLCCVGISVQLNKEKLEESGKIVKFYADLLTNEINGKSPN